jgi:trimeric autotransporter adhesin
MITAFVLIMIMPVTASSNMSDTVVTIHADGNQRYFLGKEMIRLSGTNAVTDKTYLFIHGNKIPSTGGSIKVADPTLTANKVVTGNEQYFQIVNVQSDKTWSWTWDTSNVALEAGTYTIYAVSAPKNKNDLSDADYGSAVVMLQTEKPTISATLSQSTINKGDPLLISGVATGNPPSPGVAIWIIGPGVTSSAISSGNSNYLNRVTAQPDSAGKFSFEINSATTNTMGSGTGYIIVQHPMYDDAFDLYIADGTLRKLSTLEFSDSYKNRYTSPEGYLAHVRVPYSTGGLIGADAEDVLIEALKDSNIGDIYTELQFTVIAPTSTTHSSTIATTNVTPTATTQLSTVTTTSTTPIITTASTRPMTTAISTATVNYSATIERLERENVEQNIKIDEQGNILDQITNFLRNVFGWK